MNTRRSQALTVLLLLGLAIPAAAQRDSSPRPSPRPSPSTQSPRPSPRPSPSIQAPRPAPRPVAPAPRQSAPSPRPSVTPSPRVTQPRVTSPSPAPGNNARDNVYRPSPRVTTPQAPTRTNPSPSIQRPTTNTPTYPRPTTRSSSGDYVPPAPRAATPRTTTRNDDGGRPVGGTISRPTTGYDGDSGGYRSTPSRLRVLPTIRSGEKAGNDRRPAATESRYPRDRSNTTRVTETTRTPVSGSTRRTQPGSARITERSRSTTGNVERTRYGAVTQKRGGTPITSGVTSTTPRLVPRVGAPHLGAPRAGASLISGVTGPARTRTSGSHHYSHRHNSSVFWSSWWDPWCHSTSYWNNCWSWSGGSGAFYWSTWLWNPWFCYRSRWWDDCYSYSWYYRWSRPFTASNNYWWYPSSTYCPTYLQVPSTVVIVDTPAAVEPVDDGATVVAGSAARPAAADVRSLPTDDLAAKYVDLGRFYFEAGRFTEAADAFSRARSYAPDDAPLHFELADAAFANGDYHYAAFLIAEGIRLDPKLAAAAVDKRTFYGDEKLFDLQMETLQRYLDSKPYDAQAHLVHGYNLRFSAQPEAAAAAFRRVLEITPENRTAQVFLAALEPAPAAEAKDR